MNIVSTYDVNQEEPNSQMVDQNESSEEEEQDNYYFENKNYKKNRQQVLAKATRERRKNERSQPRGVALDAQSLSSTER